MTSLASQVSVSELMHMREVDGLSNKQIALRLGCSSQTVYNYIGGKTSRKARTEDSKTARKRLVMDEPPTIRDDETEGDVPDVKPDYMGGMIRKSKEEYKPQEPKRGITVTADRRVIDVQGQFHAYTIDTGNSTVTINGRDSFTQEDFGWFIRELMQIDGLLKGRQP